MSSPKLSRLKINSKKFICNEQKFKICFIVYNSNKYSTSITSSPTSSNFCYFNNNREIILKLKNHILENLTIRIKESSHSWNIENYYRQLGVNNFSYLNKLNFNVTNDLKKLVSTNSLFICHYDSTMFYELLTLNIPTIFFCDEKFWKLSKKCKNDFNILKKVNIYFNSINELIHFLNNSNKNKINQWWFKKETQNVKNDF